MYFTFLSLYKLSIDKYSTSKKSFDKYYSVGCHDRILLRLRFRNSLKIKKIVYLVRMKVISGVSSHL
jgi:hypothetical protein